MLSPDNRPVSSPRFKTPELDIESSRPAVQAEETDGGSASLRRATRAFARSHSLTQRTELLAALVHRLWRPADQADFHRRLAQWCALLDADPRLRAAVQRSFAALLAELQSVSLFAEAGVPSQHALFGEGMRRALQRMLPSVRPPHDTARLLLTLFPSRREADRLSSLTEAECDHLLQLLLTSRERTEVARRWRSDMEEALRLLAIRISGRGMKAAIRERGSRSPVVESPFYRLPLVTDALLRSSSNSRASTQADWERVVSACSTEIEQVHLHMEDAGVSSDLVFDVKTIDVALQRMCSLAEVLSAADPREASRRTRRLLDRVIHGQLHDTQLSSLLLGNMNLLARKTVERTGRGGEHYITHSKAEYWSMWRAAFGGGLLTVFTAALKMRVLGAHFPLFVEGLLNGTNYAVSFILLQVFGLVLATKQPSMTAATFAGIVRRNRGEARWKEIADFVAAITRSQLAAALGNIIAVVAGAIAFERLWQIIFRKSYLPIASARHVYETLHPFTSGTALFAVITGVILWLAALIGGWFENFATYHRLIDAVRQHPIGTRLGEARLIRIADTLERDIAGWSTSIALGYLLGFTPVVASFFGLHLDVRHVTLTTGTLALAAARYGTGWFGRDWLYWAMAGIGVTFVLNLGVSFSIAAYVALRAYDVSPREQGQLVVYIAKQALRAPLHFLLPVREKAAGARGLPEAELEDHT